MKFGFRMREEYKLQILIPGLKGKILVMHVFFICPTGSDK